MYYSRYGTRNSRVYREYARFEKCKKKKQKKKKKKRNSLLALNSVTAGVYLTFTLSSVILKGCETP